MSALAGSVRRPRLRRLPHIVGVDEALRAATRRLDAGRLAAARHLLEQVRVSVPDHPTALTLLASIAFREGEDDLGEAYRERAIEALFGALRCRPEAPGLLAPLVNLLLSVGRDAEAEALARRLRLPFNPIRMEQGEFRRRWERARARRLPPVLLVTVPKSASETVWSRLSEGLRLPRAHLSLGLFPHCLLLPDRLQAFARGGIAAKEHIRPTRHHLRALAETGVRRLVVHLRDPRQCLLSWAHFVLEDVSRRRLGPLWRDTVPPKTVLDAGIAAVLDWCLDHVLPLHVAFVRDWLVAAREREGPEIRFTTFEDFRAEPDGLLAALLEWFGVDPADFDAAAAAAALDPDLAARFGWPP